MEHRKKKRRSAPYRRLRLPKYVREHGKKYRAVMTIDGKVVRSPTFTTPAEAAAWAGNYKDGYAPATAVTLRQVFDMLLVELQDKGSAPDTIVYYKREFQYITRNGVGWHPDYPLHRITTDQIRRYINKRRKSGNVSNSTIYGKELQALQRILNLAERRGLIPRNPYREIMKPKIRQKRYSVLPATTIAKLIESIRNHPGRAPHKQRDADIIALFFFLGIRRSESYRLRAADIDWDAGRVFIKGKNANRYLPISEECKPVLARLVAMAKRGSIVGHPRKINTMFRRWGNRLGIPNLTPHVLRHSFATAMAQAGVPQFVLMGLMGHVTPEQTARYFHGIQETDRQAVAKLTLRAHTTPAEPNLPSAGVS